MIFKSDLVTSKLLPIGQKLLNSPLKFDLNLLELCSKILRKLNFVFVVMQCAVELHLEDFVRQCLIVFRYKSQQNLKFMCRASRSYQHR